jgi:hypothetical protein
MPIFDGLDNKNNQLGRVREVDTRSVAIHVDDVEDLKKARVGQLIAIPTGESIDGWTIGLIDRVIKSTAPFLSEDSSSDLDENIDEENGELSVNTVKLTLMGNVSFIAVKGTYNFSRSLDVLPDIDRECFVLKGNYLEIFMGLLSQQSDKGEALELGIYQLDGKAKAFLDGNKLFQRHAAILGSTGSGKSWTVASILERSAKLPSANLVVFDLHGEYKSLDYARHLRIPGPDELGKDSDELLFLPYWLLNTEELQTLFVDNSEFTAHNQTMAFQNAVIAEKKRALELEGKTKVLESFTLDSPVPFSLKRVVDSITDLNEEMEQGARGLKQGKFYGQFSRLLVRLQSRLSDKRYGFLFQAPDKAHEYEALARLVARLMGVLSDNGEQASQIKVIDFSEVPADILPIIVALVARLIYQIQFWTEHEQRKPIALVCDEAHLYLPKGSVNPIEKRAVEAFEKIAKEGRKYGVSLLIVSQRPSDVSSTVLSQCNNVISLRLTNAEDQNTVKKLMPESLNSFLDILPIMDVGEALVVGDAVLLPSRIKITPPTQEPLSATVDFWNEWQQKSSPTNFDKIVENMRRQSRR